MAASADALNWDMAAPAAVRPSAAPAPETGANAPMTADEFLRLKEQGFFGKHRVELRRGVVVLKMATSTMHAKALALVLEALGAYRAPDRFLACQSTVKTALDEAPEPDAFVVRGNKRNAREEITPDRMLLVVEVSITSLKDDRTEKARIYAEAGIPDYWIVNPVARQVEIRRDPKEGAYTSIEIVNDPQRIAPLFAPEISVATGDLMTDPEIKAKA